MRFLVDMPLSPGLADWLNAKGHEAAHAHRMGLGKVDDPEILRRAAEEERVVITCDLDFPRLLALARAEGPPVILLRGGNYSEAQVIGLLERIFRSIPEQDLMRSIVVADEKRLRRHRLPIGPS